MLAIVATLNAQTLDRTWELSNTKVNCIAVKGGRVFYSTDIGVFDLANGNRIIQELPGCAINTIQFFGEFVYYVTSDCRLVRCHLGEGFAEQHRIEGIPPDETPQVPMSGLCFYGSGVWLWLNMGAGYRDNAVWNIRDGENYRIGLEKWHLERENCDLRGLVFHDDHFWSAEYAYCQIHRYSNDRPRRRIIETIDFHEDGNLRRLSAFWIGEGRLFVAFEMLENNQYNTVIQLYKLPVKTGKEKEDK